MPSVHPPFLRSCCWYCGAVWTCMLIFSGVSAQETVSLDFLLHEMLDRESVLKAPEEFTCRQFSSFDRRAGSPEENWFANGDTAQFLRTEERNGKTEWVLMDVQGPGAVVRWWITAPQYRNRLFVYVDGASEPTFSGEVDELVGGAFFCEAPLSQETARGRNLYLPIPYAKSLKITCDAMPEQKNLYYQINYRTYAPGTKVESLTPAVLQAAKEKIRQTNETLGKLPVWEDSFAETVQIVPGECVTVQKFTQGAKIRRFTVCLQTADPVLETAEDLAQFRAEALRSLILEITFDGKQTVQCPLGDFFGSGVGVNPYRTWWTEVREDGTMSAFWPMPFLENAEIRIRNVGKKAVSLKSAGTVSPLDETFAKCPKNDFLYFHANWRQERMIETLAGLGTRDWNYAHLEGRGVLVGDVLSVLNRVSQWWGEGDEKIYIDGETFPSHFGTGTEDYYGYAWCMPKWFESPWRAQPRAEGPGNFGNTTNLRFRTLDRIPFTRSLRFDMEVWHWSATKVDYAAAVFWYGTRDAKILASEPAKLYAEAASPVSYKTPFQMEVCGFHFAKEPNGHAAVQGMRSFPNGQWVRNEQLWWHGGKPGDELELRVTIPKNARTVRLGLTRACDYGIFEFFADGKRLGGPWDACNPVSGSGGVIRETLELPIPEELADGKEHRFFIYLVGRSRLSIGTMFGMDSMEFLP
ncbi:MAG: DUF2961 domain-containing protein [Planctomycetaceae bacterium]|nr:DUF2961 domain-containing protein [Planctomycetaceae bacterium]